MNMNSGKSPFQEIIKAVFYPSWSKISMFLNRCEEKTLQYFYFQFFESYSTGYGQ